MLNNVVVKYIVTCPNHSDGNPGPRCCCKLRTVCVLKWEEVGVPGKEPRAEATEHRCVDGCCTWLVRDLGRAGGGRI